MGREIAFKRRLLWSLEFNDFLSINRLLLWSKKNIFDQPQRSCVFIVGNSDPMFLLKIT
jgi:hypothetical protein